MKLQRALACGVGVSIASLACGQTDERAHDLSKEKVLYCVGYAHLDTQWRWDYPTTIDKYIRDTLEQNFALFDKYPGYTFNFTGSARYEMMREYYPDLYEELAEHIEAGRWFVSGSSVDEGDANVPSPESIIRQVLYGNLYFKREFGKESADFMLPDCFGFPASMPSIWAHCGLKGFSTQKLTWGSAMGIPFKIGEWVGPDGRSVVAALDPGAYVGAIKGRVDLNPQWVRRVNDNGERFGVWADYHYYGVGDQGGAPRAEDVENYLASIDNPDSQIKVVLAASDQLYRDLTPEQRLRLPRYKGDLLLTEHSAGTLTSQSYMKRWNRQCEQLADAAERAAVAASWLGAMQYPRKQLERSWVRFLANQMHDILPGTSIPRAYTYSWNDEIIALNGFASVLTHATGGVARALDTDTEGVPIVVVNPLAIARNDVVEARVQFGPDQQIPAAVRVFGPDGRETLAQLIARDQQRVTILFVAPVEPNSFSVFDVRPARSLEAAGLLQVTDRTLENEFLRVTVNDAGDIASIFDKQAKREVLSQPSRLAFTYEMPQQWPAWNMDWNDRQRPPSGYVDGPARIRVVERGPVRATIEVSRAARNSFITQRISLCAGDFGRVVQIDADIDWQSTECALKASFPLKVRNDMATYNWGLGTVQRGNNDPRKYEVPSHEWIDLTSPDHSYGVSIIEDSKYGSDKPSPDEIRLTLLYTPGVRNGYLDQHSQDWGRHQITYGIYPHSGDWRTSGTEWYGRRINQPLRSFQTTRRSGQLQRQFSFATVNTGQVDIRAIKVAEQSDWIIVRLQELWGLPADDVQVSFVKPILEAREVDGQERIIGAADVHDGRLRLDMKPYSPHSFAIKLREPNAELSPPRAQIIDLPFDTDVTTGDDDVGGASMDGSGKSIPGEMLPESLVFNDIPFVLGPSAGNAFNALTCRGQDIAIHEGDMRDLYILAAATEDRTASFTTETTSHELTIQSWTDFVGQWYNRTWDRPFEEVDYRCVGNVIGIEPAYIKRDPIAWFCTHRHDASKGNDPYRFSYLFRYHIRLNESDHTLTLPNDPHIRIFAMTVADDPNAQTRPAALLYDAFDGTDQIELRHTYQQTAVPVFEGVTPRTTATTARGQSFNRLSIAAPVANDDAVDLTFRFIDNMGAWSPHPGSGAVSDMLPRLNDGQLARNDDDTQRCVWYDNAGRFYVDLGAARDIQYVRTYSWHRSNRAPQYFSVWGASGDSLPDATFSHGDNESWELLGVVDTRELGNGDIHASELSSIGVHRYLLWVAEDMGQGTFFTEVDIDIAK